MEGRLALHQRLSRGCYQRAIASARTLFNETKLAACKTLATGKKRSLTGSAAVIAGVRTDLSLVEVTKTSLDRVAE